MAVAAPRDFRSSVEQAFLAVMRARHPQYLWRALSEDERAQLSDAAGPEGDLGLVEDSKEGAC